MIVYNIIFNKGTIMAKAKKTSKKKQVNQVEESMEKLQESAKKVWLASLGAYGRSFDEVKKQIEQLNKDSQKLFDDLAERGETVQSDAEDKFSDSREKLEAKFEDFKENLTPLSDFKGKIDEVSAKLDKVVKSKK